MAAVNEVVDLSNEGDIAVISVNSPPVNALSANVRDGLKAALAWRDRRYDERLAETLRQPLCDQTRDDVGRAGGRERPQQRRPSSTRNHSLRCLRSARMGGCSHRGTEPDHRTRAVAGP